MAAESQRQCVAFAGATLVASGDLAHVAAEVRSFTERTGDSHPPVVIFDAETSEPVEVDLRGTRDDVVARLTPTAEPPTPRAPGRPKLGVVAREITLLPRHWEWLAEQPGGASVTLRKLVEAARRDGSGAERIRRAQDAAYRFMMVVAGNEPGFEEATRALYAGDPARFTELTQGWPADVRDHARVLAAQAFSAGDA